MKLNQRERGPRRAQRAAAEQNDGVALHGVAWGGVVWRGVVWWSTKRPGGVVHEQNSQLKTSTCENDDLRRRRKGPAARATVCEGGRVGGSARVVGWVGGGGGWGEWWWWVVCVGYDVVLRLFSLA